MPLMTDRLKVFVPPTESAAILPINVKDPAFGAVGDGVTDDQAAIQAAITAAAGNGIVYFPPGTYLLNSTGPLSLVRSGTQDVQTITTTGTPGGGTFTLTFGGSTTAAIVYNASAAVVAAALNLLPTVIASGGVQCTGGALPTGVTVRFNNLGARALLTSTDSLTGGTAPATAIAHTTTGTGTATNSLHIMGAGAGATTIKASSSARRCFDLTRTADFDVFQNIEISDLTFDRNSQTTGSNEHVLFGNLISGAWGQRVNVQNVLVHRCNVVNAPVGAAGVVSYQHVSIGSTHLAASETTQTYLKNIVVEDCDFAGGNVGVAVLGSSGGTTCEVFLDELYTRRTRWDAGTLPTASGSSAGIQYGGVGFGRRCGVSNCYFANSQDVGVEIDGFTYSTVTDTIVVDSWGKMFYARNFHAPENAGAQVARWRGCEGRIINLDPVASGGATTTGFAVSASNSPNPTFGHYSIENCSVFDKGASYSALGMGIFCNGHAVSRLSVNGFTYVKDAISFTNASGAQRPTPLLLTPSATCQLDIRNVFVKVAGAVTVSGGSVQHRFVYLSGSSSELAFVIDGLVLDVDVTGMTTSGDLVNIGEGTTTVRSGLLRNYRIANWAASGDTTPHGVHIRGTGTLTITTRIRIEDCDFTAIPSSHYSVFFATRNQNQDKVVIRNTSWKLIGNASAQMWGAWPAASVAMSADNFAAATFTTATGNKYIGAVPAEIHFATGTGAAITAIDTSKDADTTYDNVYTQASGAMANSVVVPVDVGDYVKVTFATTQPTTRVRARRS